jgi:hypothetical protein
MRPPSQPKAWLCVPLEVVGNLHRNRRRVRSRNSQLNIAKWKDRFRLTGFARNSKIEHLTIINIL